MPADVRQQVKDYLGPRLAVLEKALHDSDGETSVQVLELIRAEGHPDLAQHICDYLISEGLQIMASTTGRK